MSAVITRRCRLFAPAPAPALCTAALVVFCSRQPQLVLSLMSGAVAFVGYQVYIKGRQKKKKGK
jgi:hypothetical protein